MSNNKIKIIFIGTSLFAIPSLKALASDNRFDIALVITQPDKKAGRKMHITPPPIKIEAKKYDINVLQPVKIIDSISRIKRLSPALIVLAAYGQIIPEEILNIPKYGCINIHGSLLPKYRGAACVQASILNGDKITGITIMKMDSGLDTGPILAKTDIKIEKVETSQTLHKKLANLGAEAITSILKDYVSGKIKLRPQDNTKASYAQELKKEDGRIDWKKNAVKIERQVRALYPWPGAYTKVKNKKLNANNDLTLKILEVDNEILDINKFEIGEVFLDNDKLAVQCGQGALVIKRLQVAGKQAMSAEEFLRGNKDIIGAKLYS